MASFNFPSSPALNDTYTPVGGPTFSWNGSAWTTISQGVPTTVYVSDNAPGNPALGQLWWDSDSGNMFIWYADADSAQWVQVSGTPSITAGTAQTRNRIVNGAMQISQENGDTTGVAAGFFCADQWAGHHTGMTTFSTARYNFATTPEIYVASSKAALAAGDYSFLQQRIEGTKIKDFLWGTANARSIVLRFEAFVNIAGTYSVCIINGTANNRTYLAPFTLPVNTWTIVTLAIPGDTTGTWAIDTTYSLGLDFVLAAGSTNVGVNGWQAGVKLTSPNATNSVPTSTILSVRNVGLYLDPLSTGIAPPWQMPDEAEELRACQRYFYDLRQDQYLGTGLVYNTTTLDLPIRFPVAMRGNPAVSSAGVIKVISATGAYIDGSIASFSIASPMSTIARYSVASSWVAGHSVIGYNLPTNKMIASARM